MYLNTKQKHWFRPDFPRRVMKDEIKKKRLFYERVRTIAALLTAIVNMEWMKRWVKYRLDKPAGIRVIQ